MARRIALARQHPPTNNCGDADIARTCGLREEGLSAARTTNLHAVYCWTVSESTSNRLTPKEFKPKMRESGASPQSMNPPSPASCREIRLRTRVGPADHRQALIGNPNVTWEQQHRPNEQTFRPRRRQPTRILPIAVRELPSRLGGQRRNGIRGGTRSGALRS